MPVHGAIVSSTELSATQAEQETGTEVNKFVSPGRQHFHASAIKCWLKCGIAADITASYNITSLTDVGTGLLTITIATDFSSTAWSAVAICEMSGTTYTVASIRRVHITTASQTATAVGLTCLDNTATSNLVKDPVFYHFQGAGDQ